MAVVLKKAGSLLTQLYLRDCAPSSLRGLFIRGLPVYTYSNVTRKGNDTREEKNVDCQEKNEKKTKEDSVFSASLVVHVRRPQQPPNPSEGSGGKIH
ncbi:hypothetical protein FCM35_KLT11756 [Carex littledalei]|uniref:Uncharacterized protein n=1 Tax=Carex littledalei TaxID=544730 RepID=A0A833QRT6_9POAL|nr:hypothetical protein FCM35_KLT11756 [Carex littledalei]